MTKELNTQESVVMDFSEQKYFTKLQEEMDKKNSEITSLKISNTKTKNALDKKTKENMDLHKQLAELEEKLANKDKSEAELKAEIKQQLSRESFDNAVKAVAEYEKNERKRISAELKEYAEEKKAEINNVYEKDIKVATEQLEKLQQQTVELNNFRNSTVSQLVELNKVLTGGVEKIAKIEQED